MTTTPIPSRWWHPATWSLDLPACALHGPYGPYDSLCPGCTSDSTIARTSCAHPEHMVFERIGGAKWCAACGASVGQVICGQPAVCLTVYEREIAWDEWRNSQQCHQILLDMSAGALEFSDALCAAFMAGIDARDA